MARWREKILHKVKGGRLVHKGRDNVVKQIVPILLHTVFHSLGPWVTFIWDALLGFPFERARQWAMGHKQASTGFCSQAQQTLKITHEDNITQTLKFELTPKICLQNLDSGSVF